MAKKHTAKNITQRDKTSQGNKVSQKEAKKVIQKSEIIPEKYQDLFFIGLLFLLVYIFFSSAIFGNGFYVSDNLASKSFETYVNQANKDGNFPQWIPYIFSGMPSFAAMLTTGARAWAFIQSIFFNIIGFFGILFSSDVARLAMYYVIYGTGIYILMRTKDHERFVAFFTSAAAVFSTSVIVWIMIGHNTKPVVFAMFPFVILLLEQLRLKFSILHTVLLVIVVHIMMEAGHVQMIFYGIVTFALYLLFEFISRLISKRKPIKVLRAAGLLALAGGIAFIMSSDRYLSTMEYTPHSTRGSGPIEKADNSKVGASGGNDYEYATMWSYSPQEMMLFLVPNYFGFGKLKYSGPATRGDEVKLPAYWGQKPFDDAAAYMGIGIMALAVLGFIMYRSNVFVQFLFVASLFSLLLSFGKNLPFLFDLFYYYVPSFNKFRAPSMALIIMQFTVPILAGYGLTGILNWRKNPDESSKKMMKGLIIGSLSFLGLGFLFALLFKTSYIDAVTGSENSSFQSYLKQIPDYAEFIYNQMITDWLLNGVLLVLSVFMIFYFVKGKLSKNLFFVALAILLIVDLWRVDFRPMEVSEKPIEQGAFVKTDIVQFLEQDKSVFRIADMAQRDTPNGLAYFKIQNINGYHSAKLRVYQDIMDVANMPQAQGSTSMVLNPFLWNLMNVRYIIAQGKLWEGATPIYQSQQTGESVYYNPGMLPRVFFVNSVQVEKAIKILHHLRDGDFDPIKIAYIEKSINIKLDTLLDGNVAEITGYKNENIKIKATATGNNLLFISEIYYPAWKAFIDGKETKIYKTNYAFRSVVIPKGMHTLELKYKSEGFETGKNLSFASNIIVALALVLGIFLEIKKRKTVDV
ncbi:MAG: YfhO family protein [bacterium]